MRPSFLLEFIRISQEDASRNTIKKIVYFTITCFASMDDWRRFNIEELINMQDNIVQLFSLGYITVGDRALEVKSSSGGMDTDKSYIDLQFEYFDSRIDRTDEGEQAPMMSSVEIEYRRDSYEIT